jgi:choline dehydrogenase
VILAASSINSPKLLMLSGIGPAAHLAEHGVAVVADRPGVGQNLQDHPEVYIQFASKQPITLYKYWNLWGKALIGAQWLFTRTGHGASNQFESAAFIRSRAGVEYPDIQYHFLPIAVRYDGKAAAEGHGFQAHVGPMRSPSRGEVTLRSADPAEAPRILFNYMSTEQDWIDFRACDPADPRDLRATGLRAFREARDPAGGGGAVGRGAGRFRARACRKRLSPLRHLPDGAAGRPMAVVDPECRVIGVEGLRLADSSIFPRIPNGNLNGPSIMTGEKAADHILGRTPLPRIEAGVEKHRLIEGQQMRLGPAAPGDRAGLGGEEGKGLRVDRRLEVSSPITIARAKIDMRLAAPARYTGTGPPVAIA